MCVPHKLHPLLESQAEEQWYFARAYAASLCRPFYLQLLVLLRLLPNIFSPTLLTQSVD